MSPDYDHTSPTGILRYARELEGKTVGKVLSNYQPDLAKNEAPPYGSSVGLYKGKGGFGQFLEEIYFKKKNDSLSQPDFPEAGLELKTAPLKKTKKRVVKAKERVVLGIINYEKIIEERFEISHFLDKNTSILLVFYFHDAVKSFYDLEIPLVDIWECLKEDGKQIQADWELIVGKVKTGLAHEISEGDTYFLGACTKGATKLKSQVKQPCSDIVAQARAFCFKVSYVNHIYNVLVERQHKRKKQTEYLHLLDTKPLTLEQQIQSKFTPFLGKPVDRICKEIGLSYDPSDKGFYARVARTILGIKKKNQKIYEFDAAGIQIKTIRIEPNGKSKEEMSFPAMDYCEMIDQEWEDSDLYQILTSKFFFVIYKHESKNSPYRLERIRIWNMPEYDLEIAHEGWEDTKQKIKMGDYDNFVRIRDKSIIHVRPHGTDSFKDLTPTPQGTMYKKLSFWLNKEYIYEKVLKNHS
jgi:DNA mismatch repair protein MutH